MSVEKRKLNMSFYYIVTTYFNSGYLDLLGREIIWIKGVEFSVCDVCF
jgi:hypothetical protein